MMMTSAAQFLTLANKYDDFSELITQMINEFIDRIMVYVPDKVGGDRVQEVEIYLKFIERFNLSEPELTPKEIKRQEQLRRYLIKSRERYQKIKAEEQTVGQPFKLICKCCGKEFESKRSNTCFAVLSHTKFCRQEAVEYRKRECTCENCGTVFTTDRNSVKYCCEACMREVEKERRAIKKVEQKSMGVSAVQKSDPKMKTE